MEQVATFPTVETELTYHFKSYTSDRDPYKDLAKLVEEGKLTMDDIEVIPAADGEPEKWKRKSVTVKAAIPVISIDGLTAEQNAHIQYLIEKQVESKNKANIDNANGEWVQWYDVLQLPPITKSGGGVKVTAEMVELVTAALVESMASAGYAEGAQQFVLEAGGKRFSPAVCKGAKVPALVKVSEIIKEWVDSLDDEDKASVAPVTDLWLANIDKIINPAKTVDESLFSL